jgi:hypothetical protein
MLKSVLIVWISLISINAFSQQEYRNSLFLEVGGSGYVGSINYERTTTKGINARIGFFCLDPRDFIVIPLTVGKSFGNGKHKFEVATGLTLARNADAFFRGNVKVTGLFVLLTGFVGYRYQVVNKRFMFRAGFTPVMSLYDNVYNNDFGKIYPWAGISGGWRF